jgi:CDP-diacylglycerol---glycerol-3-phosphate 3-phosphatidyltransferase
MSITQIKNCLSNPAIVITLIRLIFSFTVIPFLFIYFISEQDLNINLVIALVFSLVSLTDGIDGYVARRFQYVTPFGATLDLLSDKVLLISSLISLGYLGKILNSIILIFLSREFLITFLRYNFPEIAYKIGVIKSAKFKMLFQVLYILVVIVNSSKYNNFIFNPCFKYTEKVMLALALGLTLYSCAIYVLRFGYYILSDRKI